MRLEILIDSSGQALAGRGAAFGATLASLPPALDQAQGMVGAFAQDNRALGRMVDESDRVIGSMAAQRSALGSLIDTTGRVLSVVASRDSQLGQAIQQAAPAIGQLRTTLARLQETAVALAPAAVGLRASAQGMTSSLEALPAFALAARPTLATAAAVAPTLTRLGVKASPVVRRLEPVATDLQAFASDFGPVSTTFNSGIGNLLGFIEGWARAIQVGDGASHMFRNQLILSPELVQRLLDGYLRPGSRSRTRSRPIAAPGVKAPFHGVAPIHVPPAASHLTQLAHQLAQGLTQPIAPPPQVSQLLHYLFDR